MPYPWECLDCSYLDLHDTKWGDAWCKYYRRYVDPGSRSCDHLVKKNGGSGGCYLTTCMCNILGYDDHCITLDSLRSFRDNYMKNNPECIPLLEDYDVVGPLVCDKMLEDENKTRTAHIMLCEYITPAINSINDNDYETTIEIYKKMTLDLMDHYEIDDSILSFNKKNGYQRKIRPSV